jgi:hypothetical protein
MSGHNLGDVEVIELSIKGSSFEKNFVSIDIYESVFTPGIVANITINDADDFINNQKIAGGEEVSIAFRPPGMDTAEYKFIVNSIKDTSSPPGQHSKSYVVECVSEEVANARDKYVSKQYDNKQFSAMVDDIFKEFIKSQKKLDIEETKGMQKYLVPTQKPFQAIDMIRRRSVSPDNQSSSYVFFENRDGYVFKTIEKIFKDKNIVKTLVQDSAVGQDFLESKYNNILAVTKPQQMSITQSTSSGVHKAKYNTFNWQTGEYKQKEVETPEKSAKKGGSGERIPTSYESKHKDQFALQTVAPVNNERKVGLGGKSYIPEASPVQRAYADSLASSAVRMSVYGDPTLKAGVMITANLTKKDQNTTAPGIDSTLSGDFLISGLRHMIKPPGIRPRYTCEMELVKGSYEESFA